MSNFSEKYFDGGEFINGKYASYSLTRFEIPFDILSNKIIERINPKCLLDIGCAKGFLVDFFTKKSIKAFGIDISEYAINEAPENVKPFLKQVDLNLDKLPFYESFFDTIVCMGTIEYVQEQEFLIDEIKRVLKKGGIILITTLNKIPTDDTLRVYFKTQKNWDETFKANEFICRHDLASKIFKEYIIQLNKFELFKNDTFKKKIGTFLYKIGFGYFISNFFFKKQLDMGYTILGYQKA
jgi:SAM-dependent methyltransferase